MNKKDSINKIIKILKKEFENDSSGHDWWHTYRVYKLADKISKNEKCDSYKVSIIALLHDLDDWKFKKNFNKTKKILKDLKFDDSFIKKIIDDINLLSFKGAGVKSIPESIEGKIVQDADRLDAIGAIGIARVFAFGGFVGRKIYNPDKKPVWHRSFNDYAKKNPDDSSMNHFYEKIILLKDRMNTKTAKKIVEKRHKFLLNYLEQFFKEWELKD